MANQGKKIEILDNDDNLLYPMTAANCVRIGDTGKLVGDVIEDIIFDVDDLKDGLRNLDGEVSDARNSKTVRYPTLKERIDAIEDKVGTGGGGGGGNISDAIIKEVEAARTDSDGTLHGSLSERLDDDYKILDAKFGNYLPIITPNAIGNLTISNGNLILDSRDGKIQMPDDFGNFIDIISFNSQDKLVLGGGNNVYDGLSHEFGGQVRPTETNRFTLGHQNFRWNMIYTNLGVDQTSDKSMKEDIRMIDDEKFFNMIKGTSVRSYLYKQPQSEAMSTSLDEEPRTQKSAEDNDLQIGILAQDLARHEMSKYVLNKDKESGLYSISLYNYSASLHSALRHEIGKRESLEKTVSDLTKRIEALETKLP